MAPVLAPVRSTFIDEGFRRPMKALRYHARRPRGKTQIAATKAVSLAPGLRIMDQSAIAAQVRLRGSSWALDSMEGAVLRHAPMFTICLRAFTRSAFGSQDGSRCVSRWRGSLRSEPRFAFDQSRTLD